MENKTKIPKAWGQDPLSEFIQNALHNTYATFVNLKPQYTRLKAIYNTFQKIIDNLHHTREWFAAFFLMRAHSSYLGGVRLSLSGQIPEAYMVLRGCLENSLYGLYISLNPSTREIWLNRHNDDSSKKLCKKEFMVYRLFQCLESVDRETYCVAKGLYENTIDLGAHPNELALTSLLTQSQDESNIDFNIDYLTGNTMPLHLCLKNTARVGVCSLCIFKNI